MPEYQYRSVRAPTRIAIKHVFLKIVWREPGKSHAHAAPTLLSCFDVYGSQIASEDSGKVLNSNLARRFGLTATLWQFHRVAAGLAYMNGVHVWRTCTSGS